MKKLMGILLSAVLAMGCVAGAAPDFDYMQDITVVSREDGSGTRGAFVERLDVEKKDADGNKVDYTTLEAVITNNTNVMRTTASGNEEAIGYSSMGSLNGTVKALKVNGVDATVENIPAGAYKVACPFSIDTKGDMSEAAADFVTYILSTEGQVVIAENGYITLASSEAYAGKQVAGKVIVAGSSSVTSVTEQ